MLPLPAKLPRERATPPTQMDKFDEHHTSQNISVLYKIKTPEGAEVCVCVRERVFW